MAIRFRPSDQGLRLFCFDAYYLIYNKATSGQEPTTGILLAS